MISRPAWPTERVPGQPGLQRNLVSKTKQNKRWRAIVLYCTQYQLLSYVTCLRSHTHRSTAVVDLGSLGLRCRNVGNTKTPLLSLVLAYALDTFPADGLLWIHVWAEVTSTAIP